MNICMCKTLPSACYSSWWAERPYFAQINQKIEHLFSMCFNLLFISEKLDLSECSDLLSFFQQTFYFLSCEYIWIFIFGWIITSLFFQEFDVRSSLSHFYFLFLFYFLEFMLFGFYAVWFWLVNKSEQ